MGDDIDLQNSHFSGVSTGQHLFSCELNLILSIINMSMHFDRQTLINLDTAMEFAVRVYSSAWNESI